MNKQPVSIHQTLSAKARKVKRMRTFCTIITSNYLPYAVTLFRSLQEHSAADSLYVLICDESEYEKSLVPAEKLHILQISQLYHFGYTDFLLNTYHTRPDALRWSMKPVLIHYLLDQGYEKVIFLDCDIFFVNDCKFLFDELDQTSVLLTPHWTTPDPQERESDFLAFFNYGAFNAGFIGATRRGIPALEWWAAACRYGIEVNHAKGLHVDQKYLDALPVFFEDVKILRHKGCNISFWNQHVCRRVLVNGEVKINGIYPVVFIHFNRNYIPELLEGHDRELFPYFNQFRKTFEKTGYTLGQFIAGLPAYSAPSKLARIKYRLRIRTRIKNWLFRLSKSL
ncbi:MAG: hypothetical protein HYZ15_03515 [Sphingobacteriales bacterium]|nr:hypothetical protein [Sphingobacteriales bacterium]